MTLTQSIQDAITRAQTHPASKDRNKTISKLEDALAWAERLERNGSYAIPVGTYTLQSAIEQSVHCNGNCRPDFNMYDRACPIHGTNS